MAGKSKEEPEERTDWHRLFGLVLRDFFTGSPFEVDTEKDLSLQQQRLDVVILRKRPGTFQERLPDGLDDLVNHNLLTFKSHHEALNDFALKELTGHNVNYRKQLTPRNEDPLPESEFHLYAVCSRFPQVLASEVPVQPVQAGVYNCQRGTDRIRVVVVAELPQAEHNAPLHLFSASGQKVEFGAHSYRPRSRQTSSLLLQLLEGYFHEGGVSMSYTLEDFERDFLKTHGQKLVKAMPPEQLLEALTPEQLRELKQLLEQRSKEKPSRGAKKPARKRPKP
jgi:hypothetical protein